MNRKILHSAAFIVIIFIVVSKSSAQTSRMFAVTGKDKGLTNWSYLREIDAASSTLTKNIFSSESTQRFYDALSGREFLQVNDARALHDSIAAMAYDASYNRLYFTPMHGTDLRYMDLNSTPAKLYVVRHQQLKQFVSKPGEEDVVTRMTFASDGYGYALTNNGHHLIRFTTGEKITIQDLGSLIDGKKNGTNSVHSPCQSWGGDMVADAFGKLYLVTQRGSVYKINPKTLVTDYVGVIKNLPKDFTANGAAVDAKNNVIISSAVKTDQYYSFNLDALEAAPVAKSESSVLNASDLSSANLLYQSYASKKIVAPEVKGNAHISIYPNPVVDRNFNVLFSNIPQSNYSIELLDASGQTIFTKTVNAISGQAERVYLPASVNSGAYILRVISTREKSKIYTDKVIIGD